MIFELWVKDTNSSSCYNLQEILLDCDQSDVLLARIIFSCILAFSLLSTCIRDPASIWDWSNIRRIPMVTGVEVIRNCLPVCLAPLSKYGASKIMESRPWPFGVTWRHRSWDRSTRGGRLPMVVHSDHPSIWHRYEDMAVWSSSRKALPGTEVGRSSILHWSHILLFDRYVRNVAREE